MVRVLTRAVHLFVDINLVVDFVHFLGTLGSTGVQGREAKAKAGSHGSWLSSLNRCFISLAVL